MHSPGRDANESLVALERLYQKKVVTLEEAQAAAKLITGDSNAVFPPPAPPPAPSPSAPAPPAAPAVVGGSENASPDGAGEG